MSKHLSKKDKKRLKVVKLLNQINSRFIDWIDTRGHVDMFPVLFEVFFYSLHGERFLHMEWKYKYGGDL